jgi:hypothetical protein
MTGTETVTTFAFKRGETPVRDLLKALNAYLKSIQVEPEECGFSGWDRYGERRPRLIPGKYRWLIAYAIEGGSEGYYVHIGALTDGNLKSESCRCMPGLSCMCDYDRRFIDFGAAKTYSPENAYALAREAQRFLTAAEWN